MTGQPPPLRAVLFDLGGTLFEPLPRELTERNLLAAVEAAGQPAPDAQALRSYHELRAEIETAYAAQSFFLHRDLVIDCFTQFAAHLGWSDERAAESFFVAQRATVTTQLRLRDGVVELLGRLRDAGLVCAIVSNIDDDYLLPLLARSGLEPLLAWALSSESARSCKPDPEIYRQALQRIGFAPAEVLFVGDSLANDVLGPARLGMGTCWLTERASQSEVELPDDCLVVRRLDTLDGLLGLTVS
ncbi:MAG: HAD family hydrolase [Pseudomonadota bacterium]